MPMRDRLFRPVDIAPLVFFRIVGGLLMTAEICGEAVTDYAQAYVAPAFHFHYPLVPWLAPWPPAGVYAHFAFNAAMGLCVSLGLFYRVTTILLFVGQASLFLMEQAVYINHTYLYCLVSFLLIFLPCHRAVSLDCLRDRSLRSGHAPAWCVYLLRFQIAVVYLYAGVAKLQPDWLDAIGLRLALRQKTGYPIVGALYAEPWTPYFFAWGGLLFDLLVVPGLLWKRTRPLALAAAVFFHVSNAITFGIGTFPWFSLTATLLFLDPRTFRRLPGLGRRLPPLELGPERMRTATEPAIVAALALYAAVQILVPLRSFAYPGDVNWTEEGHNFSWRMMLRVKSGRVVYVVRDPATGRTWTEYPARYLTALQYRRMLGRPELIRQFAHFLADRYASLGVDGVEVRARALIRLNERPARPLVDPKVDLAAEPFRWGPSDWILAPPP